MEKASYLAGSWEEFATNDSLKNSFDLILMSETLYNVEYYESLMGFIDHSLA